DDLTVSLRHGYQVSSVYQTGPPGCTIDPWPGAKDPWHIQRVQIFSLPPSGLATRLISQDYALKRVTAGLQTLGGIPSLYDLTRAATPLCTEPLEQEHRTEITHRFWFYPRIEASPRFLVDAGLVLICKPVGVQLLTEQMFLDKTGQQTPAGPATPQ